MGQRRGLAELHGLEHWLEHWLKHWLIARARAFAVTLDRMREQVGGWALLALFGLAPLVPACTVAGFAGALMVAVRWRRQRHWRGAFACALAGAVGTAFWLWATWSLAYGLSRAGMDLLLPFMIPPPIPSPPGGDPRVLPL